MLQKRILATICIFFIAYIILKCQQFNIAFGPIYTLTNQSTRMVNSCDDFQNTTAQIKMDYEHFFKRSKFSIFSSLSKFEGHTWIKFNKGSVIAKDGFPTLGVGFNGVDLFRFDFGINYNLFNRLKYYYLKPQMGIGIQKSIRNGDEIYSEIFEINGPDYHELDLITVQTYNSFQLIPIIGLTTGVLLWNKLDINFNFQGAIGFKAFQKMYFKYSYKGTPQETAIFEGRGTGIYTSIGIGYRFRSKNLTNK